MGSGGAQKQHQHHHHHQQQLTLHKERDNERETCSRVLGHSGSPASLYPSEISVYISSKIQRINISLHITSQDDRLLPDTECCIYLHTHRLHNIREALILTESLFVTQAKMTAFI